ncbi:Cys-tRNA(Pro) deacylase [Halopseudomonas salegens]|uniref:Cys-tRNA(Pro)/Cys-tRNA(Cys) deacylase n=1 Tax=Halopseudomonas salegens TaxID=1434072 RepID=A0A1H2F3F9_9GAMM|nr:Cys-tRNA(Pro) deacylase [Halopseudomonas salegens]SDU01859.1 Cys-tRNA(Pro)/Cys-tRNA(Cys) deacylase [Halopseudomonas salegens]
MTPAIDAAEKAGIEYRTHSYSHDPAADSYGLEAADKLQLEPAQVFKTLVVKLDGRQLVTAVLPVSCKLNLKRLAKAAGGKKAVMAEPAEVMRSSGYVLGGVSPLGQKRALPTVIHQSGRALARLYVSAGRRGLEIELNPDDLLCLTQGRWADVAD